MIETLRANPAYLKLDLYCRGARLDESCWDIEGDGGRRILRTRAGLGSGLEVILPGGLWTNVPVMERFAQESPYSIPRERGEYHLRWGLGDSVAPRYAEVVDMFECRNIDQLSRFIGRLLPV